jgi:two-component sensor histidine kinase
MALVRTLPSPNSSRLWRASLLVASLVSLIHLTLIAALHNDPALLGAAGNLLSLIESIGVTLALGIVAYQTIKRRGRSKLAWTFLTLAFFASTAGDGVWWLIQNARGEVPFPSTADPLYLVFYPLFAIGLALLPAMPQASGQRLRLGLDMGSAMLGGTLLFWAFGIGPLVRGANVDPSTLAAALAYPAGDVALLAALLLLLSRRVSSASGLPLKLLAAGTAVMLVTDALFSYQVVDNTYMSGGFIDLGYTITYILFALAAMRTLWLGTEAAGTIHADWQDERAGVPVVTWTVALPYGAILLAFGLLIWDHFHPTGVDFPVLVVVLGGIVVMLGARQFLAASETYALQKAQRDLNVALIQARDELEARVEMRTRELQAVNAALGGEIAQHQLAEAQLRASLKEKEALLKEIHHRVKNNLQVVYSLLSLQGRGSSDRSVNDVLIEGQARIRAMSLIHEKLYASPDLAHVDFGDYLRTLVRHLFKTYQVDPSRVTPHLSVVDAWLSIDTAVPCGLIVNELIANALTHAFPDGRQGSVWVELADAGEGKLQLKVIDDGVGLPLDVDFRRVESLGLQLTTILARQIGGDIGFERSPRTSFHVTFPRSTV